MLKYNNNLILIALGRPQPYSGSCAHSRRTQISDYRTRWRQAICCAAFVLPLPGHRARHPPGPRTKMGQRGFSGWDDRPFSTPDGGFPDQHYYVIFFSIKQQEFLKLYSTDASTNTNNLTICNKSIIFCLKNFVAQARSLLIVNRRSDVFTQ